MKYRLGLCINKSLFKTNSDLKSVVGKVVLCLKSTKKRSKKWMVKKKVAKKRSAIFCNSFQGEHNTKTGNGELNQSFL